VWRALLLEAICLAAASSGAAFLQPHLRHRLLLQPLQMQGRAAASSAATWGASGPGRDTSSGAPWATTRVLANLLAVSLLLAPPAATAAQLAEEDFQKLGEVRTLLQSQKYDAADRILTSSLTKWQEARKPPMEIAAILKDRGNARQFSDPTAALADLDAALKLYASVSAEERQIFSKVLS
jgi:hypothetical protein